LFGVRRHTGPAPLSAEGHLPGFYGATGWLNSPPLIAADLRGKVVLVDFWTYTCINWLRTLAYVRAWAETYEDQGLVVVGVHTPEFQFEHDVDNVRHAAKDMRVGYPIALDSDYAVWRAFSNRYWPAVYIADAQGEIRHHQFGEGQYEVCERAIQRLLREAGSEGIGDDLVSVAADGFEAQADWTNLASPETYLGHEQARNFASPGGAAFDERRTYVAPDSLKLNHWALSGDWTIDRGQACSTEARGGSRSASTPATCISSWHRVPEARPSRSSCSSMEHLPAPLTVLTSTNGVTERFPSSGSISLFASRDRSLTARLRSRSSLPVLRHTRSRSANLSSV
jgi:thiol-disulfide isomerase/thioredoxin